MHILLSWIKEFIPLTASPKEIAQVLTMAGIEVEDYRALSIASQGVVVGHVLSTEKHPQADQLCIATVSDGQDTYQVVCGASNCRSGIKTAFARMGAVLTDEQGQDFQIKKAKLRGVESFGMLCSGKELLISDDDEGIIEFPETTPVGMSLNDVYGDTCFNISLTPNLGHCSSVMGIARELSALLDVPLKLPSKLVQESQEPINASVKVHVKHSQACPRYMCRLIRHVQVGPSPTWLKRRLEQSGLRSINNVVDSTNYVLLELGHPLHAFNFDHLAGQTVIVRQAIEDEKLVTLDNKERLLNGQDLLICDAERPIALAGIIGGLESEVTNTTRHVLLESAYFDPVTIRRTSKRLGLQTDASKRFERGTDPNFLKTALDRAAMLIREVAGGDICNGVIDTHLQDFPEKILSCRLQRINDLLGTLLSRGEVETIFQRLGFSHFWNGQDGFTVHVPTFRTDIQAEIDLIEEVARLYGYDNIPRKGNPYHSSLLPSAPMYLFENEIRERFIAKGLQEFLTCDLIGPTLLNIIQDPAFASETMVSVLNPTSIEQSLLRTSLLPGLLQVVKYNIDHQIHSIAGFEVGRIHLKEQDHYKEQSVIGIVLSGPSALDHWSYKVQPYDFFDLKGMIESVLQEIGIKQFEFRNLGLSLFHSGRQASVFVDGLEIGSMGEIHPAILRRLDVSQRILFAEFNLHDLMQVAKPQEKVLELPLYPSSERDWTVTVKQTIPFIRILKAIENCNSPILEKISLADIYRSEKLGTDVQNLTFHFVYRDPTKTVEQQTVDAEHQRVVTTVTALLPTIE